MRAVPGNTRTCPSPCIRCAPTQGSVHSWLPRKSLGRPDRTLCRWTAQILVERSVKQCGGSYAKLWLDRPKKRKKRKPTPSVWWSRWLINSGNTFICQKELPYSLKGDVYTQPCLRGPLKHLHFQYKEWKAGQNSSLEWNVSFLLSLILYLFLSLRIDKEVVLSRRVCLLCEAFQAECPRL